MPNQPKHKVRGVRLPDEVWQAVLRIAEERGETASDVIRRAIERYIRTEWPGHD